MARTPLSDSEESEILALRASEELIDIDELKISANVIVVACGDGHEYVDIFDHHRILCGDRDIRPMIHQHLVNGGALVLQAGSELNHGIAGDELLIAQIGDSLHIKGESTPIVLRVHMPCGAARLLNMTPTQQVDVIRKARARLMETYPSVRVSCFADVRYADGRLRTYFIRTRSV